FNIVPAAPVPLRRALSGPSRRVVPVPWTLQCGVRTLASFFRRAIASADQLQFIRCHLTASGDKAARELGFVAHHMSLDAVRQSQHHVAATAVAVARSTNGFDPYGLDRAYIDRCWAGL